MLKNSSDMRFSDVKCVFAYFLHEFNERIVEIIGRAVTFVLLKDSLVFIYSILVLAS